MGHHDRHHALPALPAGPLHQRANPILLAFAPHGLKDRDAAGDGEGLHPAYEVLGHGSEQSGGRDGLTPVGAQEVHHLTSDLQARDVPVQVHPVSGLERQSEFVAEQLPQIDHSVLPARIDPRAGKTAVWEK